MNILVTGGGSIGERHLKCFLKINGLKVSICEPDKARELQAEGLDVWGEQLDFISEESVVDLKEKILSKCGRIDILVNNAVERIMRGFDSPTEDWEQSMKVNTTGLYLCSKIFALEMVKQHGGNIINISSIYGMVGPDFSIYQGTDMDMPADYAFHKGGIISFTRYLATRFAQHNIRVNCISPGGLYSGQPKKFVNNYNRRTPLGRMANTDDIKGAVAYLASDASAYVTGHNLVVDGGWTIW